MPSFVNFSGSGFYVAGASYSSGAVRVRYSSAPKAVSSLGTNDALNPVNYALSGPGPYTFVSVQPVSGDPLSFDIVLATSLAVGVWTVQVTSVQSASSSALTAPTAAQFQVTSSANLMPLSGGAEDDDAETIIRKHLSPALKGPNWDALIKALSVGDDINWDNARAAFDQLFLSTASGSYLERKAGDQGLIKPLNVGMDDELFRKLAIKTSANKVVHEAIREILEVYYGQDSLRAFVECELDEKYNLSGGVDLTWTLDEKETFTHTFQSSAFGSVTAAKAVEVAFALTKAMRDAGSTGFASVYQSPVTGGNRVRIYSGSLGLGSFVRVTGGSAQNVFRFPTLLNTYSGAISGPSYVWQYTTPDPQTTRASLTMTAPALIDIGTVQEGDYVVIGGDANIGLTGTYAIKAVTVSWPTGSTVVQTFDIDRIAFTGSAIQASNSAYTFYRPTKNSIAASAGRTVVVAQTQSGQVDVSIPTTTQAVSRGPNQAFYARANDSFDITRWVRDAAGEVTVTTDLPHGLAVNNQIQVDGASPAPGLPYITPGNGAVHPSSFSYAAAHPAIFAESQVPPSAVGEDGVAVTLSNGQILFCGGFPRNAGAISNSTGFLSSGFTPSATLAANRYVAGVTSTITDATEADGATQSTHTWLSTADMNSLRSHHAATPYSTGAIITGGAWNLILPSSDDVIFDTAEEYDPGTNSWTSLPNMASKRCGHRQALWSPTEVLVAGGATNVGTALKTTEIYDGASWSAGPTMNVPRTDFQLVQLSNGNLMAIGGRTMGTGHTLDDKTLALWRMDDATGPTSTDETANYNLTFSGFPSQPSVIDDGKINRALDFNAVTPSLQGTGNAAAQLALLGEWTMELWFKRATTNFTGQTTFAFVSYGGTTPAQSDNLLLNAGIDATGRLFWGWERDSGTDVTATQTSPIASHAIYRASNFNHLALRKKFTAPQRFVTGSRTSNVTTLNFESAHGFSATDEIYVSSGNASFATGLYTVVSTPTATSVTYAETGPDIVYAVLPGFAGKGFDVTFFVNGVEIQTWTNQQNANGGPTSGTAWRVAADPKVSRAFPGILDDIRISTKARDEGEIRESFLRGWGHHKPLGGTDHAIGAVTDTCEIFDGVSWTLTGRMALGRAFHRAVVLPGDYILVHGGLGYDTSTVPAITNHATVGLWPNNSLREAEIYDPNVGRWFPVRASGVRRHGHAMHYQATTGKVVVAGGVSLNQNTSDVDDAGYPEIFDVATRTWRTGPVRFRTPAGEICSAMTASEREIVLYGGFDSTGASNTRALTFIDGSHSVSGPGINGQHVVTVTPDPYTLKFETVKRRADVGYSSSHGPKYLGDDGSWVKARVGGTWDIDTGERTGGVTTLTLLFPSGLFSHDIEVGDLVYVNSRTSQFGGGLKEVVGVTSTTISYDEALGNQASMAVVGSVSQSWSPGTTEAGTTATAQPVNDPGPFLFDPEAGLTVTSTESTVISFPLYANQHYEEVEIDDAGGQGSLFPDAEGYIVFSFGSNGQTTPIKYLGRYKSGASTVRLVLDYSYKFTVDQPIGSKVTLLSQRAPYAPVGADGSAYVTASSAGRVAAEAAAEEALAAGIEANITVVYPGDRGLGGEGYPSQGAQKLSDKVSVFAGDDISEELQTHREDDN